MFKAEPEQQPIWPAITKKSARPKPHALHFLKFYQPLTASEPGQVPDRLEPAQPVRERARQPVPAQRQAPEQIREQPLERAYPPSARAPAAEPARTLRLRPQPRAE